MKVVVKITVGKVDQGVVLTERYCSVGKDGSRMACVPCEDGPDMDEDLPAQWAAYIDELGELGHQSRSCGCKVVDQESWPKSTLIVGKVQ